MSFHGSTMLHYCPPKSGRPLEQVPHFEGGSIKGLCCEGHVKYHGFGRNVDWASECIVSSVSWTPMRLSREIRILSKLPGVSSVRIQVKGRTSPKHPWHGGYQLASRVLNVFSFCPDVLHSDCAFLLFQNSLRIVRLWWEQRQGQIDWTLVKVSSFGLVLIPWSVDITWGGAIERCLGSSNNAGDCRYQRRGTEGILTKSETLQHVAALFIVQRGTSEQLSSLMCRHCASLKSQSTWDFGGQWSWKLRAYAAMSIPWHPTWTNPLSHVAWLSNCLCVAYGHGLRMFKIQNDVFFFNWNSWNTIYHLQLSLQIDIHHGSEAKSWIVWHPCFGKEIWKGKKMQKGKNDEEWSYYQCEENQRF